MVAALRISHIKTVGDSFPLAVTGWLLKVLLCCLVGENGERVYSRVQYQCIGRSVNELRLWEEIRSALDFFRCLRP